MQKLLRDKFAAAVLPGLIDSQWVRGAINATLAEITPEKLLPLANLAYKIADAMLLARQEPIAARQE